MSKLVIYSKDGCPYCKAAMDQCRKEGVPFEEINISNDPEALRLIKEKYNAFQVPVIVKDGELVQVGYEGGG